VKIADGCAGQIPESTVTELDAAPPLDFIRSGISALRALEEAAMAVVAQEETVKVEEGAVREIAWMECDACGGPLKTMGHCKYLCQQCGFLRTCMDTV
jgi:tRNA(Ile2) C34 agmatinyltransferase TiaS